MTLYLVWWFSGWLSTCQSSLCVAQNVCSWIQ